MYIATYIGTGRHPKEDSSPSTHVLSYGANVECDQVTNGLVTVSRQLSKGIPTPCNLPTIAQYCILLSTLISQINSIFTNVNRFNIYFFLSFYNDTCKINKQ